MNRRNNCFHISNIGAEISGPARLRRPTGRPGLRRPEQLFVTVRRKDFADRSS
jgi:hypothetical protein